MRNIFLLSLSVLLAGTIFATSSLAENSESKMIMVLDASGSMWGQINKKAKIDIAKKVVGELVDDLDADTELGLIAYGHRKKADCEDIESLVSVSKVDKASVKSKVNAITPKGKTPLTRAVRKAAEELKFTENSATVILVSDGIETCGQDPCAVATELEKLGVNFTTHVVGFDVSKDDEVAQLKCIADNTGGKFLSAKDASSLKESLAEAVEEVAKTPTGVKLKVVTKSGGEPLQKVNHWYVYPAGSELVSKNVIERSYHAQPTINLEPGKYIVTVKKDKAEAKKEIEITADTLSEEELLISEQGRLKLTLKTSPDGEPVKPTGKWVVYSAEEDEDGKREIIDYGYNKQEEFKLLPGKYLIKTQRDKAEVEKLVEVVGGELNEETLIISASGRLKLALVTEAGGAPVKQTGAWYVYEAEEDADGKRKTVDYTYNNQPEFKLQPGKYLIKTQKDKAETEKIVEVVGGKTIEEELIIAKQGKLKLTLVTKEAGNPVKPKYWEVFEAKEDEDGKRKKVQTTYDENPNITLLPGEYLVKVVRHRATAEKVVTIEAGKTADETVEISQHGRLKLTAVEEEGGSAVKPRYWTIYKAEENEDGKREKVQTSYDKNPEFFLLPGKYAVQVVKAKAEAEQIIEVKPGELTDADVLLPKQAKLKIIAISEFDKKPLNKVTSIEVYSAEDEDGKRKRLEHGYSNSTREYTFLPGEYLVKITKEMAIVEKPVVLKGGDKVDLEVELPRQGRLELSAKSPEGAEIKLKNWEIFSAEADGDGARKKITNSRKAKPTFTLLPGKYLLKAIKQDNSIIEKEINVAGGELTKEEVVVTQ